MRYFYAALYAFSILLINPWGSSRGEIWTQPKVCVLLFIVILNLVVIIDAQIETRFVEKNIPFSVAERINSTKHNPSYLPVENSICSRNWYIRLWFWFLFLGVGLVATFRSPAPLLSLFGQEQMGDGWLYWLLVASFTLSNSILLKFRPELFRSQLQRLIIGGLILAFSIFPQGLDWRIDYTATTGQLADSNRLVSTIFKNQQPIGLYSHRGHTAFVLAATGTLTLLASKWGWFSTKKTVMILLPIVSALLLTQTRAGIVAMLMGAAYLFGRRYGKLFVLAVLVGFLLVGIWTGVRQIENVSLLNQITSGREEMSGVALSGIRQRPLLGWGFDGFGIAYPYIHNPNWRPEVVNLDSFSFQYRSQTGQIKTYGIPTFKAHNLILDTLL